MKSIDTNHQFVFRFCRSGGRLDLFRHGPLEVVKSGGRHSTNSTQGNSKKKKKKKKKKKRLVPIESGGASNHLDQKSSLNLPITFSLRY